MEILLVLFGIAMVVGSLTGFVSLFTKSDKNERIRKLEQQLREVKNRLDKVEAGSTEQLVSKPIVAKAMDPSLDGIPVAADQSDDATIAADGAAETVDATAPEESLSMVTTTDTVDDFYTAGQPSSPQAATSAVEPGLLDKAFSAAKEWLLGGNTLVRSGIVILFIGVSFLLKYVAEHSNVPIELRLTGVAIFGIALLIFGWKQREKRQQYAWALQGGGIGILYLTTFAAMKLYHLIPPSAAFVILGLIAFLSASIAILQSALPLAILGFVGGFLAPIFTSTGSGSHVGLFSYYFVLNLAIAFIAYYKSWRVLNVLGFAFTFVIGTLWGAKNYQPAYFSSTEPFLVGHFLLFTLIAVLYAKRQATKASDYVDATLVFGTPLVGFSLQYALLRDSNFGLAYSALALAIFYIILARWILTRQRETMQFLGECFLALGIGFATLTIPLALDGRWTSAAWAVEGVGLLWVGLRQKRAFPALAGLALQLLGAGAFAFGWGLTGHSTDGHQNMYLGVLFIALSGWACGALLNQYRPSKFEWAEKPLAIWGWVWWVSAGIVAFDTFLQDQYLLNASLAWVAITSALLPVVSKQFKWPFVGKLSAFLLPSMAFATLVNFVDYIHPLKHYGFLAWALAFAVYGYLLQQRTIPSGKFWRAPLLWIASIVLASAWYKQIRGLDDLANIWHQISWGVVPMLVIAGVVYWHRHQPKQTTLANDRVSTWLVTGCAPIMAFLVLWFMRMSLDSNGDASPLMYIPLLNPLDITLIGIVLVLLMWHHQLPQDLRKLSFKQAFTSVAGVMSFTLLNGVLLRTLHHWADTPYQWDAIFNNPLVQMAFTFLWAITAFILMLLAHKKVMRHLWMVGAALMALVVAKIFLLDLVQTGTVERIASFMGAGMMLLVMGYFAPLPPAKSASQALDHEETA